jgi:hypothetical protein
MFLHQMTKNKAENTIIKYFILSHLSEKVLRCNKVQKLKCSFLDVSESRIYRGYGYQVKA